MGGLQNLSWGATLQCQPARGSIFSNLSFFFCGGCLASCQVAIAIQVSKHEYISTFFGREKLGNLNGNG